MKVFLIERPATWCEDDAIVIVAEDKLHAERRARLGSDYFRKEKDIKIKEIDLDKEQVVLISNVGA